MKQTVVRDETDISWGWKKEMEKELNEEKMRDSERMGYSIESWCHHPPCRRKREKLE